MLIKTLVENTTISDEFNAEHGLSLYIETKKNKILFDLGASPLFVRNAEKLNVDLSKIDLVVISHGHQDHGDGLEAFFQHNNKANIYVHKKAFDKHYSRNINGEQVYIGLDRRLMSNDRFVFTEDYLQIDEELELFSNVRGAKLIPSGNQSLLMESDTLYVQDDFAHEQSLIITESDKKVLVAGCAHKGIVNIIDHYKYMFKTFPSHVIGGFHLNNPVVNKCEDPDLVMKIGNYLKRTNQQYYTCHCTGIEPYHRLKGIMGEKIQYLGTGSTLRI